MPDSTEHTTDLDKLKRGICPACGNHSDEWGSYEDSGHDICFACPKCPARFGVQLPPFNIVERIDA